MVGKVEARKAALKVTLVELAEAQIAAKGLSSLKARPLAVQAGCALGAIYNVFEDMSALVLEVNGRTFSKIGGAVRKSLEGEDAAEPCQKLILMSQAYLQFASTHTNLWRALFDVDMSRDTQVPEWYGQALDGLLNLIRVPAGDIFSDLDAEELDLMTRALFSSVHGTVLLGLERRISGVPDEKIAEMIRQVLTRLSASASPQS